MSETQGIDTEAERRLEIRAAQGLAQPNAEQYAIKKAEEKAAKAAAEKKALAEAVPPRLSLRPKSLSTFVCIGSWMFALDSVAARTGISPTFLTRNTSPNAASEIHAEKRPRVPLHFKQKISNLLRTCLLIDF